jgi:hypothetical protein
MGIPRRKLEGIKIAAHKSGTFPGYTAFFPWSHQEKNVILKDHQCNLALGACIRFRGVF